MASTRNPAEGPEDTMEQRTPPEADARPIGGGGKGGDDPAVVFAGLVENGRFMRDTRLGGMFHRGKVSLREVCRKDSLHVSVGPDNRVSVHVDRYSPLAERLRGNRIRYSPVRVLVHNAGMVADLVLSTLRRRRGLQRCELECGRVWVDDEGVVEVVEEACEGVPGQLGPQGAPREHEAADHDHGRGHRH